jgi:hypothetical protein
MKIFPYAWATVSPEMLEIYIIQAKREVPFYINNSLFQYISTYTMGIAVLTTETVCRIMLALNTG